MALYCKKCQEEISRTQYDFYAGYCKNCYGKKVKSRHTENELYNVGDGILMGLLDIIGDLIPDVDSEVDIDSGSDCGDGIDFFDN